MSMRKRKKGKKFCLGRLWNIFIILLLLWEEWVNYKNKAENGIRIINLIMLKNWVYRRTKCYRQWDQNNNNNTVIIMNITIKQCGSDGMEDTNVDISIDDKPRPNNFDCSYAAVRVILTFWRGMPLTLTKPAGISKSIRPAQWTFTAEHDMNCAQWTSCCLSTE